jgi:hypothetical protein
LKAISPSEYTPNSEVEKARQDFVNKYGKLAVTVKSE